MSFTNDVRQVIVPVVSGNQVVGKVRKVPRVVVVAVVVLSVVAVVGSLVLLVP